MGEILTFIVNPLPYGMDRVSISPREFAILLIVVELRVLLYHQIVFELQYFHVGYVLEKSCTAYRRLCFV